MRPVFLGGEAAKVVAGEDYREQLALWISDRNNKLFAKDIGNIVWAHFMGVGIIIKSMISE